MAIKDTETSFGGAPLMEQCDNQRLRNEVRAQATHELTQTIPANRCDNVLNFISRHWCLIVPFLSIILYIWDVGTDFYTAIVYFMSRKYWYFGLTLAFIFLPNFIIVAHDIKWYVTDHLNGNVLPKWKKIFVAVLIGFHIAPILRYIYLLQHEISIRHKRKLNILREEDRNKNAKKDYDSSFLKLLESYFECAPQLVIQICILLQIIKTLSPLRACIQVISVIGSLMSLSLSMVFLQQFKKEKFEQENFSIFEKILRTCNQLLLVTSRIIAMSLLATVCPYRLVGIIVVHWLLMVFLILQLGLVVGTKTTILVQFVEYAELAVILIFSFISFEKDSNKRNGTFYYLVVLVENIMMMVWWSLNCDKEEWYFLPGIIIHCTFFATGILMNVIFYVYYKVLAKLQDQAESA